MYVKLVKTEKEYNIVFLEKPLDEGLSMEEVVCMYHMLSSDEALPFEVKGAFSRAFGLISKTDAEMMSCDFSMLKRKVREIIEDPEKEHPDREYEIEHKGGISTMFLSQDLDPDAYRGLSEWASRHLPD
jgi:hypothetical protein